MALVCGVGFNDGKYPTRENGKLKKEYRCWSSMMARCYSEPTQKNSKSYIGCEVSENFKSYTYFHEWCQDQIGFGFDGWDLDKDLLVKGNKIYSEEDCVFLPREINRALQNKSEFRGDYATGCRFDKLSRKFQSWGRTGSGKIYLGSFSCENDAFLAYKHNKEKYLKSLAEKYKDVLDIRAYLALMQYCVNIDD